MYNKNNNGPRTLPCGTPDMTSILELHTPSTLTLWVRLDKKFWNSFKIKPPNQASRNLNTRPPWLTLSKAALKSIWTSSRSPPLSNSNWPVQMISKRASQVPKPFLYECWWDDRAPDLSKKLPVVYKKRATSAFFHIFLSPSLHFPKSCHKLYYSKEKVSWGIPKTLLMDT